MCAADRLKQNHNTDKSPYHEEVDAQTIMERSENKLLYRPTSRSTQRLFNGAVFVKIGRKTHSSWTSHIYSRNVDVPRTTTVPTVKIAVMLTHQSNLRLNHTSSSALGPTAQTTRRAL